MAYFPAHMPGPEPSLDEKEFWGYCRQKQLRFQSCLACGMLRHPPGPICPRCHATEVEYVEAPDEAVVYSYTIVHHASHPAVSESLPYVIAVLEFPSLPGVRLISNITGIDLARAAIGLKCRVWWDDIGDGMFIPRYQPTGV